MIKIPSKITTIVSFLILLFLFFGKTPCWPSEQLLGLPVKGLKGTIYVDNETAVFKDLKVNLSILNVSDSPIEIDPWQGNWFIVVFDEQFNVVSAYARAIDQLRPFPKPKVLQPGEKWDTEIVGLKLKTGLGESTPDWEYNLLKPGIYWLKAEYTSTQNTRHPKMWSGALGTKEVKIRVVEH